jgi:hypothetical protein
VSEARRHDWIALVILTSLITLLFIDVLAGAQDLYEGDLFRYAWPNKKVLRDVVLGGEFPYWNRAFSGGQPMAANPAHAAFYPLTWLILLPSFGAAFQWFIVLHLYGAAWFMYAFLRSLALSPPAAFLGALSFAIGGLVLSYVTLLPILTAIVWIPLTLLFTRRFLLHRVRRDFVLGAVCFAMQLLVGEPTTILQTGLLLIVYAISRGGIRAAGIVMMLAATALLLAAVAVLPAIDHAADSVRARGFSYEIVTDWSMPPARLGELLHANLFGHNVVEGRRLYWGREVYGRGFPFVMSIYPGLLVSVLAAAGIIARVRGSGLTLALIAISVLLALGDFTPLWRLLYSLGLARSIRYPEKFILTGIFVATVFAVKTLDIILRGDERLLRIATRVAAGIALVAVAGAVIALTPLHPEMFAAIWTPPPSLFDPMVAAARKGWLVAAARAALLLILLIAAARAPRRVRIAAAGAFVLLDLGLLAPELARRADPEFLRETPAVLRNLPPNRGEYRLFHHAMWHRTRREVVPFYLSHPDLRWVDRNAAIPMAPIAHGFQLALDGDYDYTSLLASTDFHAAVRADLPRLRPDWLEIAASMSNVWYRVVYQDPRSAFAAAGGRVRDVQPVGILRMERAPRYAFAERIETAHDRAEFVRRLAAGGPAKGTAYIDGAPFPPAAGVVRRVTETANTARLEVETAGRAFLTISVTPHKYWRVRVDGRETPAVVTNIGYQGVVIPTAGRHVVEMRYRNPLIAAGAAISLLTLLVLLAVAARRSRKLRAPAPSALPAAPSTTMRAL